MKKPKTLKEWAGWIGGIRWLKKGHNFSEIPDEELKKVAYELWGVAFYRRKLRRFIFWLKKGDIAYIVRSAKRIVKVRGHYKIPFLGMKKFAMD